MGGKLANSVVIAHSISTNWLIKYISEFKININALISVGGALQLSPKELSNKDDYHYVIKQGSLPTSVEIDFAKNNIKNIYLYYSDNDRHSNSEMFEDFISKLNATPIFCKGYGHFSMRHNIKDLPNIEKILKEWKTEMC